MPALGDIIRVVETGTLLGENFKNVYHYLTTLGAPLDTVTDFSDAFAATFHPALEEMMSDEVAFTLRVVEDLDDVLFFGEFPLSSVGLLASPAQPSFVAYGVKLQRTFKTTRNGSKRYAGVVDGGVDDNDVILSSLLLDAVAAAIVTELEAPAFPLLLGSYVPIIFRPANSVPTSPAQATNPISAASFSSLITSQVSRKPGRGE